jgi:hypothetical protein
LVACAAGRIAYGTLPAETLKPGIPVVWLIQLLVLLLLCSAAIGFAGSRARARSTVIDTVVVLLAAALLLAIP